MKHAVLVFVVGLLVSLVGVLFKITHWSFSGFSANQLLLIGTTLEVVGGVLILYKLFTHKK